MASMRIHAYLAQCGVASRRRSERLISEGRVAVNGQSIAHSQAIDPENDRITVDERMVSRAPRLYYAFHKPVNVICSAEQQGRHPLVWDFIPQYQRLHLFTVGRLDRLTSGLLLITNDGAFSRHVLLPRHAVEREYVVRTYQRIPRDTLRSFTHPAGGADGYRIVRYRLLSAQCAILILTEGRHHEVRNIMRRCGCGISSLVRVRIGSVMLDNLPVGGYRELTKSERGELHPARRRALTAQRQHHRSRRTACARNEQNGQGRGAEETERWCR